MFPKQMLISEVNSKEGKPGGCQEGFKVHTRLIHRCIYLFVRNQCIRVPLGGKVCGYFLVACAFISASGMGGPG